MTSIELVVDDEEMQMISETEQGPPGPPGPASTVPGPAGDPGQQGSPGANGPSAYEVAVAQGFIGTQQQWLDSLRGAAGSSPQAYVHMQGVPLADWEVHHSLGFKPGGLRIFDSGGNEWDGIVEHVDDNNLIIHFTSAFGGTATLS